MAWCSSCGAEIEWARTKAGKGMPLDVKPNQAGNVTVDKGEATVLTPMECMMAPAGTLRMSHFATCPNADKHRKPR